MVECLLAAGVDFMLVGGYAVALHGWPRTTFDIDFWIMANPENAKSILQAIRSFGAPLMDLTEEDFHKPGMVFQIGTEPQRIDIVSAVDGLEYSDAVKRAVKMNVDGLEIKVISIDDLMHLTVDIDREVSYDAPVPSQSSEDLSEFLEFFNDPANKKKYMFHTNLEKELLFYFNKISEEDKKEIIEFTKIKARKPL